jgi:hypothetical protein
VLRLRLLEGRPLAECAALFGTAPTACAVHVLRAGQALAQQLGQELSLAQGRTEEEAEALWLQEALERPALEGRSGVARLAVLLRDVQARRPALQEALRAAALAEEGSPAREREELLRRAAILLLVALTLYFTLRG